MAIMAAATNPAPEEKSSTNEEKEAFN